MAAKPQNRALVVPRPTLLPTAVLREALRAARRYVQGARAKSTRRAYTSDWKIFKAWCAQVDLVALPAEPSTVALFLAAEAERGKAPSTLQRRVAAIRLKHLRARVTPLPTDAVEVTEVMAGIRRDWGRPPNRKAPAVDEEIQRMVDTLDLQTLQGLRDRALILVGFAGAFRRSELVALDVEHLTVRSEGLEIVIPHSKGDQEARGQTIAIPCVSNSPYCPVRALAAWREAAGITTGAVFRRFYRGDTLGEKATDRLRAPSVALVVKALAEKAGLEAEKYSGHSLRRGLLTSAARRQASIWKMAAQSRHRSLDTLRQYVAEAERFENHAAHGLLQPRQTGAR
jgi:integrase